MKFVHTSSGAVRRGGRPRKDQEHLPPEERNLASALSYNERTLVAWAHEAAPMEACGLLLAGVDGKERLVRLDNLAGGPGQFRLANEDVIAIARANAAMPGSVRAVWHSHPGGSMVPSPQDRLGHPFGVKYLVIVCPGDRNVHYFAHERTDWEPMKSAEGEKPVVWGR